MPPAIRRGARWKPQGCQCLYRPSSSTFRRILESGAASTQEGCASSQDGCQRRGRRQRLQRAFGADGRARCAIHGDPTIYYPLAQISTSRTADRNTLDEGILDEVGIRGEQIPRFSRIPSKTAHFNSLRPRVCSDYFSLEDILVFWRSGAYKKYPI